MRKLILSSLVLAVLATKAMADYSNTVMSLGPVAYWQLNETNQPPAPANLAPDKGTAGSDYDGYYGTASAVGFPGALVGDTDTAAHFSGASGGVTVPYGPVLALKAPFTVEGWFNPDDDGDTECAVAAGNFGTTRSGWLIYKRPTGWDFRMYNQNGGNTSLDLSGGDVTTGIYHHVVAVYDGTSGYVYVDGALAAGPTAPSGFVPNADGAMTIGTRSDGSFGFPGYADEVALYTNALSASTVLAHYQNGTNATPSSTYQSLILSANPIVYYRLGDTLATPPPSTTLTTNYGSLGADYNGTLLPGTYPGKPGPFGTGSYSVKFVPATGGYVDCTAGAGLDITGPMTVIGWFKGSPADDSRFQSFLGISDSSWRADASGGVAHWADGFDSDVVGVLPVNDGNWHFFAGVYDGANNLMYIDGALDGTAASPTAHTGDGGAHSCVIGGVGDYIPSRLYQGSVAQVAVYSSALSASQILAIYNSATLPPSVKIQPTNTVVNQGSTATVSVTAVGSPTLAYQWYKTNTPLSGQTSNTLTLNNVQPVDAGNYRVVIANNYGSVTSSFAALTILQGPPVVLQDIQPVLSTNFTGMPNTFSVVVGGTPPFTYQWKRDGSTIAGATNSDYTFGTAAGTHAYSVLISNAQGSVASRTNTVVERVSNLGTTFVVNFHDAMAAQYAATADDGNNNLWTNVTYQGLGAYEDSPANTNWNGFGFPDGFTPIFDPSVSPQLASDGSLIPITLTTTYGSDNGALYFYGDGSAGNTCATCPSLVLGFAAIVNGANPIGSFTLHNVPPGIYSLYLYGANYDNDRGASFTVNSGSPHNGFSGTTNDFSGAPANSFAEGANYVYFTNIIRTVDGLITGTWGPVSNPLSGNSGEGDFNGLQLVKEATAAPILSIGITGGNALMNWTPGVGVLQSATNVAGTYTDITTATSPYTAPVSGTKFYRIRL